jgi:uncharacterized membrane protein (DUF4010 family)
LDLSSAFLQLGISLGLGLLVGLQRERVASRLAGIRTFPLVAVLGTVCAHLAPRFGGSVVAAGLLSVAALIVIGNAAKLRSENPDPGLTTEMAILLMFGVGVLVGIGATEIGIALGGGAAVLLQYKIQLHGLARRIGDDDFRAIIQFALISLVILPVLPDRTYGPYEVLNPRQIWWMVVLIVGLGLGGYVAYKLVGARSGVVLAGILGGAISSTATTVSYARQAAAGISPGPAPAVVIGISSAVVFARVLTEIAVVAPGFLAIAGPPILALMLLLVAGAGVLWKRIGSDKGRMPEQRNPSQIGTALLFAILYAVVLLAVAAAKERLGSGGLTAVAILSGLTDMDAITLSTSQLVQAGRLDPATGWRLIVAASLSNLVFKAGTVAVLGNRRLFIRVAVLYAAVLAGGTAFIVAWP